MITMTSVMLSMTTNLKKNPVLKESEKMPMKPKDRMPIQVRVFILVVAAATISIFSYNSIHWVTDELKSIPSYDSMIYLTVDVISMFIQVCFLCDLVFIVAVLLYDIKTQIKTAVTVIIILAFLSGIVTVTFYLWHTFFNNTGTIELVKAFRQTENANLQKVVNNFQQENKCCGVSNFHDWIQNDTCIKKHLDCELPESCCDKEKISENNGTCTVRVQPLQKVDNGLKFLNGLFSDGCYAMLNYRKTQALFVMDFNSCMMTLVMMAVSFMLVSHRRQTIDEKQ